MIREQQIKANFDEAKQSQLPFAEMLVNMGYRYLTRYEVNQMREGNTSKVILRPIAEQKLMEINSYEKDGKKVKFTPLEVSRAVDELERLENFNLEGFIPTTKKKYQMLMSKTSGLSINVSDSGKSKAQDFVFIDFENIENNDFAFTLEYEVSGKNNIRPDIVLFVNGIPFVVVENKKSSVSVDKAIDDLNKKQGMDYAPQLFVFPQILIATNKVDFKYGTTKTPKKFFATWREKDMQGVHGYVSLDDKIKKVIQKEIPGELYQKLLHDLNGATFGHRQIVERQVSDQDRGVFAMLQKERVIDLAAHYVLYDGNVKKIMRYQQYFGIKKILQRIHTLEEGPNGERRRGGVIWHTQGSGKSLTMVNLVREIIEDPTIENPRIIVVTDRIDLDKQISGTFKAAGLKKQVKRVKSGKELIQLIEDKDSRVITTLIQKFDSATRESLMHPDLDKNIFVLIDEAHRSHSAKQSESATLKMDRIIPNACYIAFTGTPLLKNDKTVKRFGEFIDKYTIDDALDDGVVLPLYYESRAVKQKQDAKAIDKKFERVTEEMGEGEKVKLQKQTQKKWIKDNPDTIAEIAYDIEKHYVEKFQGSGLKAQIVAPSQYSAVLFQKYFEKSGKIKTAVVLSGSEADENDKHKTEVNAFMTKLREDFGTKYEENIIDEFKNQAGGVEILIVVDKLLTGFDAPRDTVLYLAKELRDHNLLQAIARINRLFDNENKEYPKSAGFVIDYSENAQNLKTAMELFGNIKNKEDVEKSLFSLKDKIAELEKSYDAVMEMFKTVKNTDDDNEYFEILDGEENEKTRQEFYQKVNEFARNFAEAAVFRDFANVFDGVDVYSRDLKRLLEIRKTVSVKNAEDVDFSQYKNAIIEILDKHVSVEEVQRLTKQIDISNFTKEVEENIKDTKAKAEAIAAKMEKTIRAKHESDPEYYDNFSEKVKKILEEMYAKKIKDLEALEILEEADKEMSQHKDNSLPKELQENPIVGVLFRNLKSVFAVDDDELVRIVMDIFDLVRGEMIVDWEKNIDVKNRMRNKIDDYLYDELGITDLEKSKEVQEKVIALLINNVDIIKK